MSVLFCNTINSGQKYWLNTGRKKHFSTLQFHHIPAFSLRPWEPWPEKEAELATDDGGSFMISGHMRQKSILSAPLGVFETNL